MKAIMLAAGKGIRCYPLTHLYPKLLLQVCGIPVLEYMLSWFAGCPEVEKLYVVMNHACAAEGVRRYVESRPASIPRVVGLFARLGYEVEYSNPDLEIEILSANGRGTGGDLRSAIDGVMRDTVLGEDFIVCNSDYVTIRTTANGSLSPQLQLDDVIGYHRASREALGTRVTVALVPVNKEEAGRFGVADVHTVDGFRVVRGFEEKPEVAGLGENPWINAGVYVIDCDCILSHLDEYLPDESQTSLERTLLGRLAGEARPALAAYLLELYRWFDIATPEQLVEANMWVAQEARARREAVACHAVGD